MPWKPVQKAFLLFLLLASLSHASWVSFCQNDLLYCSVFPISMLIVALVLVFLYMLAKTIMAPNLEAWVKLEIRELITGTILAIIVVALLTGVEFGTTFLTGGVNMAVEGANYLSQLNSHLAVSYESAIQASHYLTALSGYSYTYPAVPIYYGSFTYTSSIYPGASVFLPGVSQAAQGLANAMFAYSALKMMLEFFTSPALLVPLASLGFVFRIIPFTRQLGNTIIGLAVGAGLILPFSVLVMKESHNMVINSNPPLEQEPKIASFASMKIDIPDEVLYLCTAGISFFGFDVGFRQFLSLGEIGWGLIIAPMCSIAFAACFAIVTEQIYPIVAEILQIFFGLRLLFVSSSSGINAGSILEALQPYLEGVNQVVVLSYVDVLVVAIITIAGTKSITTAIGGEYYLVGLQRLI